MTFFNKKNEVISIELTSYGKYLLSKGKFKPVYYEFLDTDILYDGNYGGLTENRNDIADRIKNETPRLKPQYVFTGVETKLKELLKIKTQLQNQRKTAVKDEELIENIQTFEKLYVNSNPLGNSNLDNKYPALNFYLYNSEIQSSNLYKKNNSHIISVPEIKLKNINYTSSILIADRQEFERDLSNIQENQFPLNTELSPQQSITNPANGLRVFPDDTYISVEDKSIMLQFFEENAKNDFENFEIEVFTYETGSKGQELIRQLYFDKAGQNFVNDVNKVENYFEIIVDGNISQADLSIIKNKKETVIIQPATSEKLLNKNKVF
jgi:hypothetical protein